VRGILVAGTDTGIGKTFVASALCRSLRRRGLPVVGLKPFETGCQPEAQDAAALEAEARSGLPLDLRCPVRYRAPLAPAAAAEREGIKGTLNDALEAIATASQDRIAVVELAGGLFVPVDRKHTNLDLAMALKLPVLLVGRNALGTLNHTTLSVEALQRRRLEVAALVLSRGNLPADPSQATNVRWARELTGVPVVLSLPRTSVARASLALDTLFEQAPFSRLLIGDPRTPARRPKLPGLVRYK
jgi:dethiobiotin synthetase